jgi:hypothetical protein
MNEIERDAVKAAWSVQDASNLSGVVLSFAAVLRTLRESPNCTGNAWLHAHPAAILFADKIASLTGVQNLGCALAMDAYAQARQVIDSERR